MTVSCSAATVLAVDPGEHIGWCLVSARTVARGDGPDPGWATHRCLDGWQVAVAGIGTYDTAMRRRDAAWLNALLGRAEDAHGESRSPLWCVVEHFTFTQKTALGGSRGAVEVTGAVRALASANHSRVQVDTRQTPAQAKLVPLPALRELGFYARGDKQTDHALMAARHAVLAVQRVRAGLLEPRYDELADPERSDC